MLKLNVFSSQEQCQSVADSKSMEPITVTCFCYCSCCPTRRLWQVHLSAQQCPSEQDMLVFLTFIFHKVGF